jgi:N-methylhydantoinase A/oxoprolinase/acetone carboxylase beta subunit
VSSRSKKGYYPRDFTLVAFGGGGPLHACSLARALRVPRVLVPVLPGALSALGILLADTMQEYSRTVMQLWTRTLKSPFQISRAQALQNLRQKDSMADPFDRWTSAKPGRDTS